MELFVARQPIFDSAGELDGYELLYRGGAQRVRADGTSTEQMSLDVIIQSFLEIGLDRITRIVKLTMFVASTPFFTEQPKVANGASLLLAEVFGDAGQHARSAVGVSALPLDAPVELELLVEVA